MTTITPPERLSAVNGDGTVLPVQTLATLRRLTSTLALIQVNLQPFARADGRHTPPVVRQSIGDVCDRLERVVSEIMIVLEELDQTRLGR